MTAETAPRIATEHVGESKLVNEASPRPLDWSSFFIFVCCHRARDVRCGACGPELLKQVRVASSPPLVRRHAPRAAELRLVPAGELS